jgi:acyl-CoA synthetase (AMP-forming)/AMP-acid ligase II/3-oxoacyl-(acyl-carrier-protein) synthase/acyl carrier protein
VSRTLLDVLFSAARDAPDQLLVQVDADGAETQQTYAELLQVSLRVAGGFRAAGLDAGQPVILLPGGSADFLPAFWGALLAGLVPVPLAPVTEKVQAVWTQLRYPPVVVDDLLEPLLRRTLPADLPQAGGPRRLLTTTELRASAPTTAPDQPSPSDLAFLQFSSGSTGAPKGVELSHANVVANIDQVCTAGAAAADDVMVSWLPYFHDMGLVGAHLAPTAVRIRQVRLDPLDVVRRPGLWFEAAARHRGTLLPAASFALAVTLERLPAAQVPDLDLTSVRLLGVGAEPISVPVWRRFLDHMRPAGLDARAVVPLYGLAEATVAVSFPPLGERAEPLVLDRAALARGLAVDAPAQRDGGGAPGPDADAGTAEFLDVGFPVAGGELRIVDDARDVLGDSCVGHVEFRGPNVARGYHGLPEATAASFAGGWLRTGDVGFLRGGRLCITGRAKDVLFVHGQKYHAHDLEQVVAETPGVPPGRVAVVGATDPDRGTEQVAVFVATREPDLELLAPVLTAVDARVRRVLGYADVRVLPIAPDAFPRTTSGKTRRGRLRERFVAGEFAALEAEVGRVRAAASAGAAVGPQLPRHAVETLVVGVWADVLQVPAGTIDPHDRFLAVGGSSLAAMQVLHRLEEVFGTTLAPAVLRDCATPAALAEHLLGLQGAAVAPRQDPVRRPGSSDAAVVAMACRFPDASTPEAFWDNLRHGRDSVTAVPESRWVPPATLRSSWGAFLDDVDGFDAEFFGVEDADAAVLDPHARLFLEVAHEALERAGYAGARRTGLRIGVFVAVGESGYAELLHRAFDHGAPVSPGAMVGNLRNLVAARVAHRLDLSGPALTVDTACSSSLVALHLARRSLDAGECDLAVVGGVSLNLTPTSHRLLDAAQALSATGRCRAFSADADGIVLGEGAAALVLQPVDRCRAAGDRVLAVVRGSAVNNDGRSLSLLAPNPLHQEAVIVDAYRDAGIDPATVGYVEAHGTGTAVGDPIEARSLMRAFPRPEGPEPRWLGSVKTNIGHLLNAAGMPSLVKVVLALQHRELPAVAALRFPGHGLRPGVAGFELVTRTRPWEAAGPRRAGVNGFGFGGTNAHVILEEAPDAASAPQGGPAPAEVLAGGGGPPDGPRLLTLSAASEGALRAVVADLARYVAAHPDLDEGDVCASASTARDDAVHRVALVVDGDLAGRLQSLGRARAAWGAGPPPPEGRRSSSPARAARPPGRAVPSGPRPRSTGTSSRSCRARSVPSRDGRSWSGPSTPTSTRPCWPGRRSPSRCWWPARSRSPGGWPRGVRDRTPCWATASASSPPRSCPER